MAGRTPPPAPALSAILQRAALNERVETSPIFGNVLLRELTRREWRDATKAAEIPEEPTKIYLDIWNASIFAAGVCDPDTRKPAARNADEVLDLPRRDDVWDEILRLGNMIMELSEVGQDALKSSDSTPDAE